MHSTTAQRIPTGRWTVLGMFGFGLVMVGVLWILFEIQTRPFRLVTEALHEEFPDSRPLVQGGVDKKQDGEPNIFRVVLTVSFDPVLEEQKFKDTLKTIRRICEKHHDLSPFDRLEVHLIKPVPEQEPVKRKTEISLRD